LSPPFRGNAHVILTRNKAGPADNSPLVLDKESSGAEVDWSVVASECFSESYELPGGASGLRSSAMTSDARLI
jgi:hypothetical protein